MTLVDWLLLGIIVAVIVTVLYVFWRLLTENVYGCRGGDNCTCPDGWEDWDVEEDDEW